MNPDTLREMAAEIGLSSRIADGDFAIKLDAHAAAWEVQNDNNEKVKEALRKRLEAAEKAIYDGRLCPAHFEAWAEQFERRQGYKGSELGCLLWRLAALAAGESET